MTARRGLVHGNMITLDSAVPPLEGRLVQVMIEPLEDGELELAPQAQAELWRDWAQQGPQGPIEEDGETEFP